MFNLSKIIAIGFGLYIFSTALVLPIESYTQTTISCKDPRQRWPSYPPC